MRAAALVLALALGGCRGSTAGAPAEAVTARGPLPTTADGVLAACEPYRGMDEVYGVCLSERGPNLASAADVEIVCPKAGAWEAACRGAWVQVHGTERAVGFDGAVAACGTNEDCVFQLVDSGFGEDVVINLQRCEQHLQRYERDCLGHALQRWAERQGPDDAEVARVIAAVSPAVAVAVAQQVGMVEACFATAKCDALAPEAAETCRRSRDEFRQMGRRCPTPRF